ncbi:MAG: endonuclease domain-containing protein [Anaerolineae bacterium]
MPVPNIVRGQWVNPGMLDRAKRMRREMTRHERILWDALRRNQLDGYHFRRQQVIDGYIVDFYCHAASLVVETDGPIHDQQRKYDEERDERLARRGLLILRVRNEEIERDLVGVLERIRRACRERT